VAREVGTEGRLGGQADVRGAAGTWKDLTDSVNSMAGNLTRAGSGTSRRSRRPWPMATCRRKITVDVRGEILELKKHREHDGGSTELVWRRSHAGFAREVGTEGILGGQADVKGVAGTWKRLDRQRELDGRQTSTAQVRNIADVTTRRRHRRSVEKDHRRRARRDLGAQEDDQYDGRPAALLRVRSHAPWPERSATEGKLGGQAEVRDVAGHPGRT